MHTISIADVQTNLPILITQVEAGEQIAITRNNDIVAYLVSNHQPQTAAELFRSLPDIPEVDLEAPQDLAVTPVAKWN
ncbi:hypothetical protein TI05_10420 [Achromatium sp. WMS3]|nr:hypothetical protein TI05_10420 [Achromatium sp. WMS3]